MDNVYSNNRWSDIRIIIYAVEENKMRNEKVLILARELLETSEYLWEIALEMAEEEIREREK
jgi:hypothetical protein